MIRFRYTARSHCPWFAPKIVKTCTTWRENTTPSTATITRSSAKSQKTLRANAQVSALDRLRR